MRGKGFDVLVTAAPENIQYLTGVSEPSIHTCGVAIIPLNAEPTLAVMWLDEDAASKQASEVTVKTYTPYNEGEIVAKILEQAGAGKGKAGMDGGALRVLENSLRKALPNLSMTNAGNAIDEIRWIKSDEEIRLIQKACTIADKGMKTAIDALKPGITELEVSAIAESEMISLGSDELKHRTIIASGPRTGLIHPFATQKKIAKGELVAIDLGAVYQGYCSDIARTAFMGKPTEEAKMSYETLRGAQDAAFEKVKHDAPIKEIEAAAYGVAKSAKCELIGHVGHSIGLRTEEDPHLWSARMPIPEKIEANMAIVFFQTTIQSKGCIGPRVEDTLLVTKTGAKRLTTYPRELASKT